MQMQSGNNEAKEGTNLSQPTLCKVIVVDKVKE